MLRALRPSLALEALIAAFVMCCASFVLQGDVGFGWADEGLLWYASQRTHAGELAIRDFFAYDPGRYDWNSWIFSLLGDGGLRSLLIAAAAFGALGLATSWYAMGVARVAFGWRLVFGVLLAIGLGYPRHKVYEQTISLLLVCVAFLVLTSPRAGGRWFVFGVSAGLAAAFGRNHGVFFLATALLLAIYLTVVVRARPSASSMVLFPLGVVVGYLPVIVRLAVDTAFRNSFLASVQAVAQWQLPVPIPFVWRIDYTQGSPYDLAQATAIGVLCVLIPTAYLLVAAWMWRGRTRWDGLPPAALLAFAAACAGLPYLQQAFDRADFGHIAQATLPVFVLLAAVNACRFEHRLGGFAVRAGVAGAVVVILLAWLPSQPGIRFMRMEALQPGSTQPISISGSVFRVNSPQAEFLSTLDKLKRQCGLVDRQLLAMPHFPGVYAYLGLTAPFWEMYYLYARDSAFQKKHIEAIADVKVVVMAPEATFDNLERLKLRHTYGDLLDYVHSQYRKSAVLPYGAELHVRACGDGDSGTAAQGCCAIPPSVAAR
ncbi:hypothetical protein [Pseudorhodoferax sp. Leaf265]|uniref:hypothetical protein n=1 Tax=Pseudorhodoferax sp. Leaf265 TaxID=1736315 RepID=UPI0006F83EB3|nr:hypothetical protein [Pseudorhodoferax sp. Leaf265]KQP17267.1 hypothetical protein ASF45_27560 [Pseudorhodoferax sp. Leaf265]